MLIALEIFIVVFVASVGTLYLLVWKIERNQFAGRLNQAIETPHDMLMRKYDCQMEPAEAEQLNQQDWR